MRITLSLFVFLLSFNLFASTTHIAKIEALDYPDQMTDDVLVFLSTGQVAKISDAFLSELAVLNEAKLKDNWLKLTLNAEREIIKIEPAEDPAISYRKKHLKVLNSSAEYEPSVLKSMEWANRYFREARRKDKESQCFNRAHVWSYEWMKKHKFYSSKMFIFFTRKFIREQNFAWWFHVAPYVHVVIGSVIKERVMDMKYMPGPSTLGGWIKRFVKNGDKCLTVQNYSDYANYPENGSCYLMRASMYHYWPLDLETEELHGTLKTYWVEEEVNMAYLEAFDIVK